jgi:hypothetical protein
MDERSMIGRREMFVVLALGTGAAAWLCGPFGASEEAMPTPSASKSAQAASPRLVTLAREDRAGASARELSPTTPDPMALLPAGVNFAQPRSAPSSYVDLSDDEPDHAGGMLPLDDVEDELPSRGSATVLPAHEQAALRLYASMLDVFEDLDGRCDLIGERVARLVGEQGGALRPERMAGDSSDPSRRPLDGSAQAQLERFRARLRDTLGKCRGSQALLGALRELSMLASS